VSISGFQSSIEETGTVDRFGNGCRAPYSYPSYGIWVS
jgi:hypothetical protein